MNVLFVIATNNISGQELSLLDRIRGLRDEGVHCEIVMPEQGQFSALMEANDIKVHFVKLNRLSKRNFFPFLKTVYKLTKLIRSRRINIVHASGAYPNQYCLVAARLTGVRCVVHINTTTYSKRSFDINFVKHSDMVIAISEATKKAILGKIDVPNVRIITIYNGIIDEENLNSSHNGHDIKKQLGIDHNEFVVGQIGEVIFRKGVEYFIEMASIVVKKFPNTKFLLIGRLRNDDYLKRIKEKIKDLGLEENIIFTDFQSNIDEYIKILDISVLFSIAEGHGRVIVESLAQGKPVIGTAVDGIIETIIHNDTGLLVGSRKSKEMAEAVIEYLSNPDKAQVHAQCGQQFVLQRFTKKVNARHLSHVYHELVDDGLPKTKIYKLFSFIKKHKYSFLSACAITILYLVLGRSVLTLNEFLLSLSVAVLFILAFNRWQLLRFKMQCLRKIQKYLFNEHQYPKGSVLALDELITDKYTLRKIKDAFRNREEYVLGEIDQEGRFCSSEVEFPYLRKISQDQFIPRKRYKIEVVVLKREDYVIAIKKNFKHDRTAALREAAVLTLLTDCQTPKLLNFNYTENTVYLSYIAGESLRDKLSSNGVKTEALDLRLKQNEITEEEKQNTKKVLEQVVNYGDILEELKKINAKGVVPEDIKYGNLIIETKTQKPFWIDFHAAKVNKNNRGLRSQVRSTQMKKDLDRIFLKKEDSLHHV